MTPFPGTTVNAVLLVAYGIGNAASPLMWKDEYTPRFVVSSGRLLAAKPWVYSYRVPWTVIAACNFAAAVTLLVLRVALARENKRRDGEQRDETYDDAYIKKESPEGTTIELKVDKVTFLQSYVMRT
jgi:ACS family allantoate permease-like MFS transporter